MFLVVDLLTSGYAYRFFASTTGAFKSCLLLLCRCVLPVET
jgi:hypothetical protein